MRAIIIFLLLLCLPNAVSSGEVYRWVDDQGVSHFTDDFSTVPEGYRSQAEVRETKGESTPPSLSGSKPATEGEDREDILVEDDFKSKDEPWWRSRAEKWRGRLQAGYDKYEAARLRYNEVVNKFNTLEDKDSRAQFKGQMDQIQKEMQSLLSDIKKCKEMMERVLPEQARKAGKPIGWVQ